MNQKLAVIVLLFSAIGWGLTWIPIKAFNQAGLTDMQAIFIAFFAGSLVLTPLLIKTRETWLYKGRYVLLIGLTGGFANLSFQAAMTHGDVIRVMILFYLLPVWSIIGARLFLKEKPHWQRYLAVMMSLGGVYLILGGGDVEWISFSVIDLLAIGAGMALAMTNILFRATPDIAATPKVAAIFLGCTIQVSLTMLIFKSEPLVASSEAIIYTALYGLIWLMIITFGTQWAVTRIEAGRASVILVIELVAAVLSAAIINQVMLTPVEITGGLLVMLAAIIEGMNEGKADVVS